MGLFGSILKTGFDVLTSPIEIAKDVVTLGGALTDNETGNRGTYTTRRIKQLGNDLGNIRDDLGEL